MTVGKMAPWQVNGNKKLVILLHDGMTRNKVPDVFKLRFQVELYSGGFSYIMLHAFDSHDLLTPRT